ncbi:hypothetical protein BAE44_0003027 [Dichanthelium oligosanthes]|uniref:Uncharacterized protein n=1 Tax=Dichanthelium oligosanthes TaxID=888268 RepID=A0A1E5WF22_9POAL|nr:hypothetical protein BAE44_0003027 [Dichanthelium oligosanthes]
MDATLLSNKAPPAAADDALPSSAEQQAVEPSSSPGGAAAGVKASGGVGGGEDDDEQVERFYALLDNIRAMRGMLGAVGGTATAAGRNKRAREAEPPWRPAFRMEDFEQLEEVQSDAAPCCDDGNKRKKWESSCGASPLPAARRETATDDVEEEEEGEVVEAKGPRPGQHKARRAGVLAVDRLGRSEFVMPWSPFGAFEDTPSMRHMFHQNFHSRWVKDVSNKEPAPGYFVPPHPIGSHLYALDAQID